MNYERGMRICYNIGMVSCTLALALSLCGCVADMFRNKVEYKRVDVERYDPNNGRPRKVCRIVDKRDIEVEYVGENGETWTEKHKLEGGNWTPPALPDVVPAPAPTK